VRWRERECVCQTHANRHTLGPTALHSRKNEVVMTPLYKKFTTNNGQTDTHYAHTNHTQKHTSTHTGCSYGVVTMSQLPAISGLSGKRALIN